jgi:hypothetical protein
MATKADIREYFARFGKQGGKTRAKNMTPEQRKEAARRAPLVPHTTVTCSASGFGPTLHADKWAAGQ